MFKDMLNRFIWVMIKLVKSLEWVKFSLKKEWKSMVIEGGKTCFRYEKKSNFKRAVGR